MASSMTLVETGDGEIPNFSTLISPNAWARVQLVATTGESFIDLGVWISSTPRAAASSGTRAGFRYPADVAGLPAPTHFTSASSRRIVSVAFSAARSVSGSRSGSAPGFSRLGSRWSP